jgi:hypothetical protein
MAQDPLQHPRTKARQLFEVGNIKKPVIKILFYTDSPENVTEASNGAFGLGRMKEHLEGHSPVFAKFNVKYESRYINNSEIANNRLDDLLSREAQTGQQFDQIWFFGVHQINREPRNLHFGGGTPESELNTEEARALQIWMDEHQGGVLVTGDHANPRPSGAQLSLDDDPNELVPDTETARNELFLGLGRALGRGIVRAGKLRDWEGDPTSFPGHTFNTHFVRPGISAADTILEGDPFPQRISPAFFDDFGRPVTNGGHRHPIFLYRDGQDIEFLPDHVHEGAVVLPDLTDETIWERNAAGFQPAPQVIATGINADTGEKLNLLVAYDGTAVERGRIVADSSWHHYFNDNLEGLLFPAVYGSPADQIGQFYANLAIWLCPIKKRQEMANVMTEWLIRHPIVLEAYGPVSTEELDALVETGGAALALLKRVACPCEIHELLQMKVPKERRQKVETLHLPDGTVVSRTLPSKQLLLGYLANRLSQEPNESDKLALTAEKKSDLLTREPVDPAEEAFRRQESEIARTRSEFEKLFPQVDGGFEEEP